MDHQPRSHLSIFIFIIIALLVLFSVAASFLGARRLPAPVASVPAAKQPSEITTAQVTAQSVAPKLPSSLSGPIAPQESKTKTIIAQLGDGDIEVSQKAAEQLYALGKLALPELLQELPKASVPLKGQIVFLLGRMQDKAATPVLMELAQNDLNSYIRKNAVEALGKIKDQKAALVLESTLRDEDAGVRENAAASLGALKNISSSDALLERLREELDIRVKTAIVKALGQLKDPGTAGALIAEFSIQADRLYKNEIIFSLGEIGNPIALPVLLAHLEELKANRPTQKIILFEYENSLRIAQDAIIKLQKSQGGTV